MSQSSDLAGLLRRVQSADGPDVELDGLIAKAFGTMADDARWMTEDAYGEPRAQWVTGGFGGYVFHDPDPYTESMDAAIGLLGLEVPDWSWRVGNTLTRPGDMSRPGASCQLGANGLHAEAATPALAIVAALIKAKLARLRTAA